MYTKNLRSVREMLSEGKSVRVISSLLGVSKNTVSKARKIFDINPPCLCGRPAIHSGWCAHRLSEANRVSGFVQRDHYKNRAARKVIRQERAAHPWLILLHQYTAHFPPDLRDEVRQEMALAILLGDLSPSDIHQALSSFCRKVRGKSLCEGRHVQYFDDPRDRFNQGDR